MTPEDDPAPRHEDPAPRPDDLPAQTPRTWPEGQPLRDDECVALSCAGCGTPWRVHERMRGFKLRCGCGAWLQVPAPPDSEQQQQRALLAARDDERKQLPVRFSGRRAQRDARGRIELPGDDGDVMYAPIPTDAPMAPGTLRRASQSNQTRWTNRTLLEFTFLMAALLGPQLVALLLAKSNEFVVLLPFTSLVSGVLVGLIVAVSGPFGRLGLRPARAVHTLEAVGVAGLGIGVATLYSMLLERLLPQIDGGLESITEPLGFAASIFVIAVSPAVLEEVIFRGMLQGRLMALLGARLGFFVTAAAFAIVHGQPAVLPIHLGLGLYLGWLRERSDSLLPCMLMHFLYNGTLVTLAFYAG